jgi:hypothetical protein
VLCWASASFMAMNPARVRASIDPANGLRAPEKVSDCCGRVRPSALGVRVQLCRPSKMPG